MSFASGSPSNSEEYSIDNDFGYPEKTRTYIPRPEIKLNIPTDNSDTQYSSIEETPTSVVRNRKPTRDLSWARKEPSNDPVSEIPWHKSLMQWIMDHPWLTALIVFAVVFVITSAIVAAIIFSHGGAAILIPAIIAKMAASTVLTTFAINMLETFSFGLIFASFFGIVTRTGLHVASGENCAPSCIDADDYSFSSEPDHHVDNEQDEIRHPHVMQYRSFHVATEDRITVESHASGSRIINPSSHFTGKIANDENMENIDRMGNTSTSSPEISHFF